MLDLLSPENLPKWKPTLGYEKEKPWVSEDGVYRGFNSGIAYPHIFTDFILDCDILFEGPQDGGITIRTDTTKRKTYENGYELDIDWGDEARTRGHIHFPIKPMPWKGHALIDVGKWHAVRIRAEGPRVIVFLDGKQVLMFEDTEFVSGRIVLQGEKNGVRYRNLRVTPLTK